MVTIKYNEIEDKYYLIDGDKTVECKVDKDYRDGPIIKIPENSSNRRYLMVKKFNNVQVNNEVQLSEKEYTAKVKGGIPTKPTEKSLARWFDVMTDEEKAQYEAIKAACEARLADPVYKARLAFEKAKAEYEALLAQQMTEGIDEELPDNIED